MKAGDTFFPVGPECENPHLYVIVSDAKLDAEKVLIVSFTSWRADKDQACVVEPGAHPFIQHRSCMAYANARVVSLEKLEAGLVSGSIDPSEPISDDLLRRIRQGALMSDEIRIWHRQILVDQELVDF